RTVLREYGREEVRRVISQATANEVLLMMEGATHPGGWAASVFTEGLRIAAKTGTAQVPDPTTGGYSRENFIASVIGMFPVPEPKIILYVVIQYPKGESIFGSRIAAPLFKKALDDILLYYDIPKEGDPAYLIPAEIKIPVPESIKIGTSMPDLSGLPKRYLAPLFETGLDVLLEGDGYVVSQNPPPGTTLRKGMKISLILQ
ncbi:MAG: PASTA domain-containing protein, partial [Spirochaetaceae bacterium]